MLTFIRRSSIGMIQYQYRLALNLGLWWGALQTQVYLVFSASPSCRQRPSSLGIEFYSHQGTDVYPVSRGFGSEWARRIGNYFRTTNGGRKPCSAQASSDIVETGTAERTADLPSTQKTDGKIARRYLQPRANELFGGTSNPLKHCWHGTRYDSVTPTKYLPDRSEGAVCDNGTDRRFVKIVR